MTPEELRNLYHFNAWANQRTLNSCAGLAGEQFLKPLGSSFSSVRDTLAHILGAECIWLERWLGRSPGGLLKAEDFPDFARLRARWEDQGRKLLEFAHSRTQEHLDAPMQIRTLDGTIYTHPLWQMMQHLVNHGSYHRGQVATLLRQLGAPPVATDLIRFYRERAAQATA